MNSNNTPRKKQILASVDIGGTFTDIIVFNPSNKKTFLRKELTTTLDPSIAALAGLRSLIDDEKIRFQDLSKIIHGTTLAGNAIIERKGALTGLIATKGFGEILTIGRESRYDIYDLNPEFPEPLIDWEKIKSSWSNLFSPTRRYDKNHELLLFADSMYIGLKSKSYEFTGSIWTTGIQYGLELQFNNYNKIFKGKPRIKWCTKFVWICRRLIRPKIHC